MKSLYRGWTNCIVEEYYLMALKNASILIPYGHDAGHRLSRKLNNREV